jgi:ATP-dependent DNA helicase RecG
MAYRLNSPIDAIHGIGHVSTQNLRKANIYTIQDLLLTLPLRYEDRSTRSLLADAKEGEIYTFELTVTATSQYYKARRSIQKATVEDESGKRTAMWFNNKFIIQKLKKGKTYLFSGKVNDRGVLVQPTMEDIKDAGLRIHTDRIIPLYSTRLGLKIGSLRRIFREVLNGLTLDSEVEDWIQESIPNIPSLHDTFKNLHYPDTAESVIWARKRLALEELLALIAHSKELKKAWHENYRSHPISVVKEKLIPTTIPFQLTSSQKTAIKEITTDIQKKIPMNRLLVGDVGSGKTVVAGTAAWHTIQSGHSVAFIAPTQILVHQHAETLAGLFPDLKIEIITSQSKKKQATPLLQEEENAKPVLYVGTHSVINRLSQIKPALIIFDEQHRFGVGHRSSYLEIPNENSKKNKNSTKNDSSTVEGFTFTTEKRFTPTTEEGFTPTTEEGFTPTTEEGFTSTTEERFTPTTEEGFTSTTEERFTPHVLTMTATPIPRSYMLTIFDHLSLSRLDEMPAGRQVTKTFLTPESKREDGYAWVLNHLKQNKSQVVHVCPFIDTSTEPAFQDVSSAMQTYEEVSAFLNKVKATDVKIGLLHGKQSNSEKKQVTEDLYSQNINWLVTTPVVEVGLDLPKADIIIIEGAERFGLASLHQLRGRVGRAGQQGFCLLFTSKTKHQDSERLLHFTNESSGFALAEYDLQNRGGGNIFGTEQHGSNELQFANWADLELISSARRIFEEYIEKLPNDKVQSGEDNPNKPHWKPLIHLATKEKVLKKEVAAN